MQVATTYEVLAEGLAQLLLHASLPRLLDHLFVLLQQLALVVLLALPLLLRAGTGSVINSNSNAESSSRYTKVDFDAAAKGTFYAGASSTGRRRSSTPWVN
jgi:hypothetical protein